MSQIKKYPKPWFSYKGLYNRDTPFFYKNEDFDWVKTIEDNYFKDIKPEIEAFMKAKGKSLDPYFNVDLVGNNNSWKIGGFYFWNNKIEDNYKFIPKLENILTSIPGFVSAGISYLEPNTDIKVHNGDTDASVRVHLGLKIPAPLPTCGLEVGKEQRGWEEGKILIFNDAQLHRAWNHSNETRYVMIIDIIRPEYLSQTKSICANALSLIKLQQLEYRFSFIRNSPGFIKGGFRYLCKLHSMLYHKYEFH